MHYFYTYFSKLKYCDTVDHVECIVDWLCVHAWSLQSCLTLCNPMDCCPPGFSVHGILQVRILEWVGMPSSRRSSWPGIKPASMSCIDRWVLYHWCHLGSPRLALLISNSKQSSDYFNSTSVSLSINCCNGFITVSLFLCLRIKQAQLMFSRYIESKNDIFMPFSFYSFPFCRVDKQSVK